MAVIILLIYAIIITALFLCAFVGAGKDLDSLQRKLYDTENSLRAYRTLYYRYMRRYNALRSMADSQPSTKDDPEAPHAKG